MSDKAQLYKDEANKAKEEAAKYKAMYETISQAPCVIMEPPGMMPSEAIFAFGAWLTTRKQVTVLGSSEDAAPVCELIKEFSEVNELVEPRDNYTDFVRMPKDESVDDRPKLTVKYARQSYGGKAKKTGYRAQIFDGDNLVNQFMDYCKTKKEAKAVVVKYLGRELPEKK